MQIRLTSVTVDDQAKALRFYTDVLGFVKKTDVPVGEYRWLTVVSPEGAEGVELVLEPLGFPPARVYQKALYDAGIPATAFMSTDIRAECARLKERGAVFHVEPQDMGTTIMAIFEDTCGNLLSVVEEKTAS